MIWLIFFLASIAMLVAIKREHPDDGQAGRETFAAVQIGLGTLVAATQIPNRMRPLVADEDLTAYAFMFLGVGGMLPLAG